MRLDARSLHLLGGDPDDRPAVVQGRTVRPTTDRNMTHNVQRCCSRGRRAGA